MPLCSERRRAFANADEIRSPRSQLTNLTMLEINEFKALFVEMSKEGWKLDQLVKSMDQGAMGGAGMPTGAR
jgi:hypothetical protein